MDRTYQIQIVFPYRDDTIHSELDNPASILGGDLREIYPYQGSTIHNVNKASSLPPAGRMSSVAAASRDHWEQRTFSSFQQFLPESETLSSYIFVPCPDLLRLVLFCPTLPASALLHSALEVLSRSALNCPAQASLLAPAEHSTASTVWSCPICLAQLSLAQTSSCSSQSCPASPVWPSPAQSCLGLVQDYPWPPTPSPPTHRKFPKISSSLSKATFGP